jgi:hypothetical protein
LAKGNLKAKLRAKPIELAAKDQSYRGSKEPGRFSKLSPMSGAGTGGPGLGHWEKFFVLNEMELANGPDGWGHKG